MWLGGFKYQPEELGPPPDRNWLRNNVWKSLMKELDMTVLNPGRKWDGQGEEWDRVEVSLPYRGKTVSLHRASTEMAGGARGLDLGVGSRKLVEDDCCRLIQHNVVHCAEINERLGERGAEPCKEGWCKEIGMSDHFLVEAVLTVEDTQQWAPLERPCPLKGQHDPALWEAYLQE